MMKNDQQIEAFLTELSKHYLGIAAALFIALTVGIFLKKGEVSFPAIIIGAIMYFLLLFLAFFFTRLSGKFSIKKEEQKDVG